MDNPSILRHLRAEQFRGKGIESIFPEGSSGISGTPWESASRLKHYEDYDKNLVSETLRRPPKLQDIDPVDLRSTQPRILKQHVDYYLSDEYRKTGKTSQQESNVGNRYPFIYRREPNPINPEAGSENVILSGHHRAAAALVSGQPLRAIIVEGPWGQKR